MLLSIGMYAYIENGNINSVVLCVADYHACIVLRYKLSVKLDACVLDRPCSGECQHSHKGVSPTACYIHVVATIVADMYV